MRDAKLIGKEGESLTCTGMACEKKTGESCVFGSCNKVPDSTCVTTEELIPYCECPDNQCFADGECAATDRPTALVLAPGDVTTHTDVDSTEQALEAAVAQQPVSVARETQNCKNCINWVHDAYKYHPLLNGMRKGKQQWEATNRSKISYHFGGNPINNFELGEFDGLCDGCKPLKAVYAVKTSISAWMSWIKQQQNAIIKKIYSNFVSVQGKAPRSEAKDALEKAVPHNKFPCTVECVKALCTYDFGVMDFEDSWVVDEEY